MRQSQGTCCKCYLATTQSCTHLFFTENPNLFQGKPQYTLSHTTTDTHINVNYKLNNLIVKERFSNLSKDGMPGEITLLYLQVCASSWCHNLHCGHELAQLSLSSC